MWRIVASHANGSPLPKGSTVTPSGRLPSVRASPGGSRMEVAPASDRAARVRAFTSVSRAARRASLADEGVFAQKVERVPAAANSG